ncbi:hypothetical protein PHMEG_00032452 [Phytophthora megakarya]|uniref:Retrotransposon gag domain-containing protein n=1 Tax=Phytophthora megakarya TaxID=4795 RepID=A0A225UVP3_9STRA|nr:hypothetical protein PHMEG_00032452 [Phytophthora megakarya]
MPRSKTVRKKMKAPDDGKDEDHPRLAEPQGATRLRRPGSSDADPEAQANDGSKGPCDRPATLANRFDAAMELIGLLKDAGMTPGSFDADALFDMDLDVIQATSCDLFQKLKIVSPDPLPLTTIDTVDNLPVSSHYASAAEDGFDTSSEPPRRMSLGPSEASMLEARSKIRRSSPARNSRRDNGSAPTDQATVTESSDRSVGTYHKFFNAAMDRYLAEEREANKDPASTRPQHQGSQDVEMESIRSSDHGSRWEFPTSAQATVAAAAAGSTGSTMIQRVRISAISDLKEFTGKDQDEDRARAWISKVKSAFMRDQVSDDEKCLTFADLLAGSAKNWYRQLSRSTRNKWSELLRSFQIQYCGLGVSVARQYYHTRRRSDESPLDYLYWLNVAGLHQGYEHVDNYIETLEDQDLPERLALLRLTDADDLEEVLRARDRAKNRQKNAAFGSSKYRQKPTNSTLSAPAKQVRAIQIQTNDAVSDSESGGSGGSDSDVDSHRKIFLAANEDVTRKWRKSRRAWIHNFQSVIRAIKITT